MIRSEIYLMTFGEKLFEEIGSLAGFKITRAHPIEGIVMELSFTSEIKGYGKFPSGKNIGSVGYVNCVAIRGNQ